MRDGERELSQNHWGLGMKNGLIGKWTYIYIYKIMKFINIILNLKWMINILFMKMNY